MDRGTANSTGTSSGYLDERADGEQGVWSAVVGDQDCVVLAQVGVGVGTEDGPVACGCCNCRPVGRQVASGMTSVVGGRVAWWRVRIKDKI